MRHGRNQDHLSWNDAAFLYLEREGVPLHIASVNLLEGFLSLADCIRFVESKIPLVPRYRQRVVARLCSTSVCPPGSSIPTSTCATTSGKSRLSTGLMPSSRLSLARSWVR